MKTVVKDPYAIQLSYAQWVAYGRPDLNKDIFKRCIYIGYGIGGTVGVLQGVEQRVEDIIEAADLLGYDGARHYIELVGGTDA
nr:MAG: hypothetical protein 1 [Guangxi cystovirus 17]